MGKFQVLSGEALATESSAWLITRRQTAEMRKLFGSVLKIRSVKYWCRVFWLLSAFLHFFLFSFRWPSCLISMYHQHAHPLCKKTLFDPWLSKILEAYLSFWLQQRPSRCCWRPTYGSGGEERYDFALGDSCIVLPFSPSHSLSDPFLESWLCLVTEDFTLLTLSLSRLSISLPLSSSLFSLSWSVSFSLSLYLALCLSGFKWSLFVFALALHMHVCLSGLPVCLSVCLTSTRRIEPDCQLPNLPVK